MIVPLDTPVATRAEKFRNVLDMDESAAYRALQETKQVYPEAEVPPLRAPRLKREGRSLVALVRGRTRDEAIRLAIEKLGGIRRIIDSPAPAILKPNFNSADPFPASTHPDTLETVVALLKEAGCEDLAVGEMGGSSPCPPRGTSSAGG